MNKYIIKLCVIFFVTVQIFVASNAYSAEVIRQINVSGNKRIEIDTIRSYLGIKVNGEFTEDLQKKSIRQLYATSMFKDIKISCVAGVVSVVVEEYPLIASVSFKGNSKIKSSVFSKEIFTEVGDSLSDAKLQSDVDKIIEIYKRSGRFSVKVLPQIEELENNRVKVIFNVTEGPKTAIKYIYFVGNTNYRSEELKSVIMTKETAWYKFMDSNDTYDPDRMEYDKELLTRFYQSVGFADVNIISATAELAQTKNYFTATYSIDEGSRYKIGEVTLQNNIKDIEDKVIQKLISIKKGQLFNMTALEAIGDKISDELSNHGYPQLSVVPALRKNIDSKTVDVTFTVSNADKVFINKINITGNVKTAEHVIRREFKIAEGDLFNRNEIGKGERRIRNLDYFDEKLGISANRAPNSKDRYDLNLEVQEKSTASIGMDVGYSTSEGPFGSLNFAERNLLGTGKHLDAGVRRSGRRLGYNMGVTDPNFMDRDLSLGLGLFRSTSGYKATSNLSGEAQPYKLDTIGSRVSAGYDITETVSHDISYMIKRDELTLKKSELASHFIKEQIGNYMTSSVTNSLTYDKLDSRIIPKNGFISSVSNEYAGVGGNNKFLKYEANAKAFKSFFSNKVTLKISGSVGTIQGFDGKKVRISDRFSVGDYNLRGFAGGGIGPRDKRTNEGINGQKFYSGTVELSFPIGLPEEMNVTGAVFSDIGALWDFDISKANTYRKDDIYNSKSPRVSVGAGVLWHTRIMPIRIDWAIPLRYKTYDDQQRFHIRMSTSF